jgi:hypothetical protein
LENWFNVEFVLLKILRLQPSELDRMEFYRAEYLMENLKDWNEKEQNQHKKQEESQQANMPNFGSSSLSNMAKGIMPSMPGMPSMPKF